MARQLNKKQKEILDRFKNINSIDDLPSEVYFDIMELNDYECVYQDVDRYLFENTEKGKLNGILVNHVGSGAHWIFIHVSLGVTWNFGK